MTRLEKYSMYCVTLFLDFPCLWSSGLIESIDIVDSFCVITDYSLLGAMRARVPYPGVCG